MVRRHDKPFSIATRTDQWREKPFSTVMPREQTRGKPFSIATDLAPQHENSFSTAMLLLLQRENSFSTATIWRPGRHHRKRLRCIFGGLPKFTSHQSRCAGMGYLNSRISH